MKITCTALVLLIQTLQCLASDDSPFQLTNKVTGFCLVKQLRFCFEVRWTTGDRLLVPWAKKCLGVQGKSVGSEISLYDCDENSDLQKWECKNGTVLALKDQELYIELTADNTAVLSKTIGPNNHLTISGTSSGACTRTYRELYTIGGNANGRPCMFPFVYRDKWYSACTDTDSNQRWCAIQTKYEHELWGYCPTYSREDWSKHPSGAYYQLNTQAALTWPQAEASCKQQGASLLSITDPNEKAYITALLGTAGRGQGDKLWTGLIRNPEHGWQWSNGRPYRYLNWDSGHPLPNPGHNCAIVDGAVQYSWQSSSCTKKLGYICYSEGPVAPPTEAVETGFCSSPWIPYNGHCFHLHRTQKTWSDAQKACRKEGGDLVSIRNVEDQSFVISQLGYASTDELWIGLNDKKTEGLFDWIDHSAVSFTSWEFGKPSVFTDQEDCVLIRGENGNWADRMCDEKHGFICMKMSASEPSGDEVEQNIGCKIGWRRHGSYCYFIGIESKTFDEAKNECESSDSYLADVSNGVDNAFLVSLVGMRPEKYFWLGLSNQKDIDQFVWTNTDSVRFTHWNAEMPGHRQGCVAMTTGIFAGLWDVLSCTNKEKYICKHLAEGAVLTPAPPTFTPAVCADEWTRIGLRPYCYKMFLGPSSNMRTWYEARDYCRVIGGDLLSIHSADELEKLPQRYGTFWIGLSAPDPVTGYVWSDGSPLQFQHWADGEPNNKNNVESCVEFQMNERHRSGSWNDVHCENYRKWLCQIRIGVNPKPPPDPVTPDFNRTSDQWLEWNGSQYYISYVSMAMEEARRFCQRNHSELVTINSEAESVFLWKQVSRSHGSYWIGLNVDLDRTYGWMDGSPVVFTRWDENQPVFIRNDENCAAMTTSMGFWHAYNCGHEHKSICKRSSSPPANATVAPTVSPKGGCPQNWEKLASKCYRIINTQKETWVGAKTQCKTMGGNLASILSRPVQVFLTTKLAEAPTTDLWIGLFNVHGNPFLWADGRPRRYNNWGNERWNPSTRWNHDLFGRQHSFHDYRLQRYEMMDIELYDLATIFEEACVVMTTNPNTGVGKWIKRSCNDTNGYVCLRNVDPSLQDSPEPTTSTNYVKIFNDSIKVVTQQMNWDAAKKHCEGDGAKLASLRNEWYQAYVELLALNLNAPLWIGLNKMETGGYFQYIDGRRLTLTNWDRREPMHQPCVFVNVDGKWKTSDCDQNMASICMKSTDVPPTESSDFSGYCPEDPETPRYSSQMNSWLPFRHYCYLIIQDRTKWPDASANCVRHGGNLASIEDPSEQEFIQSNINTFQDSQSSFWIGLYKTHTGIWKWLDKTTMDYTNWYDGQPGGNSYGLIASINGKWSTGSHWYDRGYVCKTAKVLRQAPATTVVNPMVDPQTRGHIILAVVLAITVISIGAVIALFLFKKSGLRLPIPEKLSTFDNPLFFSNERYQPDLVDAKKLVVNADEENSVSVITV
ncbi:macrophage mannose receptor 1-like [Etheostoma cragini]|uniref:macrophage mannose receptor 1-like n=1 Tax=Etheostoma cragini TaxID=417921 RepID=UPI00155E0815|nr:macrophage mannose receptor 1-like [Etheostoma cragini]